MFPRDGFLLPEAFLLDFALQVPPGVRSISGFSGGKPRQIKPRSSSRKTENKEQSIATPVTKTKRDRDLQQLVGKPQ